MSIEDFGEKIGGAKKDLWKIRGLQISDLLDMNDAEQNKFIKKDNVWKKPDYQALVSEGLPVQTVYFMKLMRDSLPAKPVLGYSIDPEVLQEKREGYIRFVGNFRDAVMALRTEEDVKSFYNDHIDPYLERVSTYRVALRPEAHDCITNKMLKAAHMGQRGFSYLDREIKEKQFCYTEDQKILAACKFYLFSSETVGFSKGRHDERVMAVDIGYGQRFFYPTDEWANETEWEEGTYFIERGGRFIGRNFKTKEEAEAFVLEKERGQPPKGSADKKSRKKAFVPSQLKNIERQGSDFREGTSVTGEDYLKVFNFKGGEFGNWLNEKDRQGSLDFAYEAFLDLADALAIDPKELSLGRHLSIAFGARGSGNALAHYEPEREVINITKMKGAGSLAHEWGHALDDILGKKLGLRGMMSEHIGRGVVPETFRDLINSFRYKEVVNDLGEKETVRTDFYKDSISFDGFHSKTDHGYYQSTIEMFARAFACYVKDRLSEKGVRSDYLCGHADMCVSTLTDRDGKAKTIKAFPAGEERKMINKNFDRFFDDMKEKGVLQPASEQVKASALKNYKAPIKIELERVQVKTIPLEERIRRGKERKEHMEVSFRENKRGQIEFDLFR